MRILIFLFATIPCICFSQQIDWKDVDSVFTTEKRTFYNIKSLAHFIDSRFDGEAAKVAAIYWWTATNIRYEETLAPSNENYSQAKVTSEAFRTKKSICEGYAGVFDSLCKLNGIQSFIVSGYTAPNDDVDYTAHAWNAAKIDNKWFLFDPTWGSGALFENKFVQRFNASYFMPAPEQMIRSHIPFDPIWQCLDFPVSHRQFVGRDFENKSTKSYYNFNDSIQFFLQRSNNEQAQIELHRINQSKTTNPALEKRKQYLESFVYVQRYNMDVSTLNMLTSDYNQAAESYNTYIKTKHSADANKHLLNAKLFYQKAKTQLENFNPQEHEHRQGKQRLLQLMNELELRLKQAD